MPPRSVVSAERAADYVGPEACRECHRAEYAACKRSPHTNTIHLAAGSPTVRYFRTSQKLVDSSLGTVYSLDATEGGTPLCDVRSAVDGTTQEQAPKYVIGSGRLGHTFLFEKDGSFMESRISYYPGLKKWAWTPGQQDNTPFRAAMGNGMSPDLATACFFCHSTMVVRAPSGQPDPEKSHLNVSCERCHGPGQAHVESERAKKGVGTIFTYHAPSQALMMHLCGQCHREPQAIPEERLAADPQLPRFTGTALAVSKCYRNSGGRLTCVTCHSPHEPLSQSRAAYEKTCRSCHSAGTTGQKSCPVNARTGCVGCHMPSQTVEEMTHTRFTNHWIRVYRNEETKPDRTSRGGTPTGA